MEKAAEPADATLADRLVSGDKRALARGISLVENRDPEGDRLASIGELQMSSGPDAVSQINGRIDLDLGQVHQRHPVIPPIDDGFQDRAEAHVGVSEPRESLAIDCAG